MPSWHVEIRAVQSRIPGLGYFYINIFESLFGGVTTLCTSHSPFACVVALHGRLQKPLADPSVGFVGSVLSSVELTLHSESGS